MAANYEFVVCDVETTGFGKTDRIIEIALVRLNSSGYKIREFATLVNPERDLGPTHVHGITARDVKDAPKFSEIAGNVISCLSDAVFTAHNAAFDARFICSEMGRLGYELPEFPRLCTMEVACCLDPLVPSRALHCVCEHFGILHADSHSAEGDANALVELLRVVLRLPEPRRSKVAKALGFDRLCMRNARWPSLPTLGRQVKRAHCLSREMSLLQCLVSKLPSLTNVSREAGEYFLLLDRILEDRCITEEEISAAHALAIDLGLYGEQIVPLHERYLRDLIRQATADGCISEFESRDLQEVSRLLGIEAVDCRKFIEEIRATVSAR